MYINNFRRFIVLMGLALTLLVGSFIAPIFAQPAPAQQLAPAVVPIVVQEPNLFELSGLDTTINYSTTSFIGSPQLTYKTLNLSRQFTGEEINTLDTNIGKLVTVLVEPDADTGKEVRLTLLLPTINLPSSLKNPIKTEAILTTKRTPVRGGSPILEGQLETYQTLRLTGTASKVDF
ncbi:MAG: hypothetical protein DSM106950_40330 [Stigonema ocellatum SAG 48.90 = DSM 106950]|nr:hypothetical protein [Stigonema ocellatum SAG 48.90 = DSM 106950]